MSLTDAVISQLNKLEASAKPIDRKTIRSLEDALTFANIADAPFESLKSAAKDLRNTALAIGNLLTNELPKIGVNIVSVKSIVISEDMAAMEAIPPAQRSEDVKNAYGELQAIYNNNTKDFNDQFAIIIKKFKQNRKMIDDSTLSKSVDDAVAILSKQVDDHVRYASSTLAPLIEAVKNELNGVDATLQKYFAQNPFKDCLDIMPSSETISKIDPKNPEVSALIVGYETLQNSLKKISDIFEFDLAAEKRKKIVERLNSLTAQYEETQKQYKAILLEIQQLRSINTVTTSAVAFYEYTTPLLNDLSEYYQMLIAALAIRSDFATVFASFEQYIKQLNLTWE
jgi:uncharacterized coiled-coil DUF342 family protein